ncbi:MAG: hypothetical protein Q8Q33_10745 [Chlamydiota bacterium]|nr:hypothetical protein [Chlamydiota bacterium]
MKKIFLLLLLIICAVSVSGCATPEGGSSLPWSEPESWERSPSFGVQY